MTPKKKNVAVLGAGVAGLTAAHELLEQGFDVAIFDKSAPGEWGGRARSYDKKMRSPADGSLSGQNAPAEHGFRFFPGFYRHIDDTLGKILIDGERTVLSNLISIHEELLAVTGKPRITLPASAPRGGKLVQAIRSFLQAPNDLLEVGLTQDDLSVFASKIWRFASSCVERRNEEYEGIDWRTFVQSLDRSEEYYWYLASGLTRTLVAARARYASTKTMGNVAIQILLCLTERQNTTDRVLNGPTNKVWIAPWIAYLERYAADRGLKFELRGNCAVEEVFVSGREVSGLRVQGQSDPLVFDHVVCALSLEAVVDLAAKSAELMGPCQQTIANLIELRDKHLTRMSGLQIYLRKDAPICRGHQIMLDSPWGLTSISQRQFWSEEEVAVLRNAGVDGVLSVDISSWDVPGLDGCAAAEQLPPFDIFKEVVKQLRVTLGREGLEDENIVGWRLEDRPEPILVNAVGTWRLRPTARCGDLRNFFLAGDYVQTKTDLACMEAASESARDAVNQILEAEERPEEDRCRLFDPAEREPRWLRFLQEMDRHRYLRGQPWGGVDISEAVVGAARALDVVGDDLLADDLAATSRGPASHGKPLRLPREKWDPAFAGGPRGQNCPQQLVQQAVERARPITDSQAEQLLSVDRPSPGRTDPMFRRWRLYSLQEEGKNYLIPFHVYEGNSLVVHGRAALEPLRELTAGTGYHPVVGENGDGQWGFAELWVVDYRDTSAGPYKELVINFVVTRRDNHRPYRITTPYSSIVPMMDPANRLFTPLLLVDQAENIEELKNGGAILYGNRLFGTNKKRATIEIDCNAATGLKRFSWRGIHDPSDHGRGRVFEIESAAQDAVDYLQLARVMGVAEVVRNARQALNGEEIQGGLVTRDRRDPANGATVDIRAAYKFAPRIRVLGPEERKIERSSDVDQEPWTDSLSQLLSRIDFAPTIATYDHHLKSVLYLDGWPSPEGQQIPLARAGTRPAEMEANSSSAPETDVAQPEYRSPPPPT